MAGMEWGRQLVGQMEFYWDVHLRPRLDGLTDDEYAWRPDAIAALDDDAMSRPLGPRGEFFADEPMSALVLHVNRELMHHGGEIGLLRDLYRRRRSIGMY